jgi:hypothetical protein
MLIKSSNEDSHQEEKYSNCQQRIDHQQVLGKRKCLKKNI